MTFELLRINKKGQLGKFVTSVPVLLLVFVIMTAFVLLSFFVGSLKSVDEKNAVSLFSRDQVLFEEVKVNGERFLVFDLLLKIVSSSRSAEIVDFAEALRVFVREDKRFDEGERICLALGLGREKNFWGNPDEEAQSGGSLGLPSEGGIGQNGIIFIERENGETRASSSRYAFNSLKDDLKESTLSIDGKTRFVYSYYGECLGSEGEEEGGIA